VTTSLPFTAEIQIEREALKFSSAHMTVFADGTKEALHGHNYQVRVQVKFRPEKRVKGASETLSKMLPFSLLKKEMKKICDAWDEKVLLPETCPFLTARSKKKANDEFTLCGAHYSLPRDEIVWLPCPTISCETLSALFLENLIAAIPAAVWKKYRVERIRVQILESPRQGASHTYSFLPQRGEK
jgi:6-pyruvoyltetrahydropterin/6-carboxytetrahydropterin synthase